MNENKNPFEIVNEIVNEMNGNKAGIIDRISSSRKTLYGLKNSLDAKKNDVLQKIEEQQAKELAQKEAQAKADAIKTAEKQPVVEAKSTQKADNKVEPENKATETVATNADTKVIKEDKTKATITATPAPKRAPNERVYANLPEGSNQRVYIPQERFTRTFTPRQDDRPKKFGDRPQGGRPYGDKPQGTRPYGDRVQGGRTFGDKAQGDKAYGDRPQGSRGGFGAKRPDTSAMRPTAITLNNQRNDRLANKQKDKPVDTEKTAKTMNKRTLIRKGYVDEGMYFDEDGEAINARRFRSAKKNKNVDFTPAPIVIEKAVITTENITVKLLSEKIGKTATEIIKILFNLGIVTNINGTIDFDTADLVASEFGITLEQKLEKTYEEVLVEMHDEKDDDMTGYVTRPPIVTIMGHVDHGKTSILDYIRKANVASGEAGGITQHIGAYTAKLKGKEITFLDTPGHEAFTSMRARGAQVTDIAVLVVAADDGIMPQTIESINHSKAAGVPIIVAINKMDKPEANPDRILQQLTEYELLPEEWGGDTMVVRVSAKTGMGIDNLLESILVLAEVNDLKGNPNKPARGYIIEARLDKGRGPVATVLVQNGTLKVSDFIVAGTADGKVRAMTDENGKLVKAAGPSKPVQVQGFNEVPNVGDMLMVVDDEKLARQVADERRDKLKAEQNTTTSRTLEELLGSAKEGELKQLNIIVKADVQGSVEAIKQSLEKLSNNEVNVKIIHGAVGAINESDVMLANTSNSVIIGFNVRPDANAKSLAEKDGVDIRTYRIIYDAIDDITLAMKGMLAPKFREAVLGHVEVRNTFRISGVGTIAGGYVTDGKILRNSKLRLLRDNIVIYEGEVGSLKRFKDDVKEVAQGYECGISISGYNDIKEGDVIESFTMEQE